VTSPAALADSRHFWERTAAGWHAVFAALLVISMGIALSDLEESRAARATCCGLLVVWGLWYLATSRKSWRGVDHGLRQVYLAGMLPLLVAVIGLVPSTSVMLFIAIPQIYATVERLLLALLLVTTVFVCFGIALLTWHGAGAEVLLGLGFSALFSGVIGAWISGIIQQSGQRAELIDELQETREQLAAVAGERGALAERERLSRDIHDTIAQGFTSIVMLLEAADAMVGTDDVAARRHLELARRTARENLAETRSLVTALTPAGLADASLVDAVRRIMDRCGEEARLAAGLTVGGQPRRLSSAAEVVLLRAAQESLANVRKHAGARRVDLHLDYAGDETVLRVSDDGCGFDPELAAGFGLNGMRARVEEAGGSLRVDSSASAGTTVEVRVR